MVPVQVFNLVRRGDGVISLELKGKPALAETSDPKIRIFPRMRLGNLVGGITAPNAAVAILVFEHYMKHLTLHN